MEFFKKCWDKIKEPSNIGLIVFYILYALIGVATLLFVIFLPNLIILHYFLFALLTIGLVYLIYTLVRFIFPKTKRAIIDSMRKHESTRKWLENKDLRVTVMASIGFVINIAYVVFQGTTGIITRSLWYITISAYYLILIIIKSIILFYGRKNKDDNIKQIKMYKQCGIMLNLLTFVFSGIIVLVNKTGNSYEYAEIITIVVAIFTFYKIITATIHLFKARKQNNLFIQCIRNVNLVDALYSILVLQVAMFHVFGNQNNIVFNAITGAVIAALILFISITMIVKSNKLLKIEKTLKNNVENI